MGLPRLPDRYSNSPSIKTLRKINSCVVMTISAKETSLQKEHAGVVFVGEGILCHLWELQISEKASLKSRRAKFA